MIQGDTSVLGLRIDPLGTPFRCMDAGVPENRDPENQELYLEGLNNYFQEFQKENPQFQPQGSQLIQNAHLIFPATSGLFAYGLGRAYTRASSFYVRKFMTGGAVLYSFIFAKRQQRLAQNQALLRNFHLFEKDVQRALESGDSRYLRKFHKGPRK